MTISSNKVPSYVKEQERNRRKIYWQRQWVNQDSSKLMIMIILWQSSSVYWICLFECGLCSFTVFLYDLKKQCIERSIILNFYSIFFFYYQRSLLISVILSRSRRRLQIKTRDWFSHEWHYCLFQAGFRQLPSARNITYPRLQVSRDEAIIRRSIERKREKRI